MFHVEVKDVIIQHVLKATNVPEHPAATSHWYLRATKHIIFIAVGGLKEVKKSQPFIGNLKNEMSHPVNCHTEQDRMNCV